jgi:hypothetical protein
LATVVPACRARQAFAWVTPSQPQTGSTTSSQDLGRAAQVPGPPHVPLAGTQNPSRSPSTSAFTQPPIAPQSTSFVQGDPSQALILHSQPRSHFSQRIWTISLPSAQVFGRSLGLQDGIP